MTKKIFINFILFVTLISPAHSFCHYRGVDYAKTTIAQEFTDSKWVVRAKLIAADYHWSDEDDSWTLYKLETMESYKGNLPMKFTLFTERNSGGFYLNEERGSPDLGSEYLLFLTPSPWPETDPPAAKGALSINYSCGQSKSWSKVTQTEADELQVLAKRR